MEEKKDSVFKRASKVYFIWLGIYCAGMLVCRATGLEYRMWVWVLGSAFLFWLPPLWLFLLWHRWHVRKGRIRPLRYLATTVFAVLFLLWSYFCFIAMVFSVEEERYLFDGYVTVNRGSMLSSYYELCRTRMLFFRGEAVWDTDFEIKYLERKYGQEFVEVPFDKDKMPLCDKGYGIVYGDSVPVSTGHPELPVRVLLGSKLGDNYIRLLTDWYVMEGCRELGIDRPYEEMEGWGFRLAFSEEEDLGVVASDVQKLIRYAMQDEIFQKYSSDIRLVPEGAKGDECIYISFGGTDMRGETKNGYEKDVSLLKRHIEDKYRGILESREEMKEYERKQEEGQKELEREEAEKGEASESAVSGEDDVPVFYEGGEGEAENSPESVYAKDARLIYEKVLVPKNIGESFVTEYDARGGEYYPLGEDGVYFYTLLYDRDSENGTCRLYVLYCSPYDQENGSYYSYLDSMTQIMDIYAVVKETGQIIPSGKKAWSDVGGGEYRKAVGE